MDYFPSVASLGTHFSRIKRDRLPGYVNCLQICCPDHAEVLQQAVKLASSKGLTFAGVLKSAAQFETDLTRFTWIRSSDGDSDVFVSYSSPDGKQEQGPHLSNPLNSRPVYKWENPDPKYIGPLVRERPDSITLWLDALHALIPRLQSSLESGRSLTRALLTILDADYFGSEGAGMEIERLLIVRRVSRLSEVNANLVGSRGRSIVDFLRDTTECERLAVVPPDINGLFESRAG